jgi:hypothetical protein
MAAVAEEKRAVVGRGRVRVSRLAHAHAHERARARAHTHTHTHTHTYTHTHSQKSVPLYVDCTKSLQRVLLRMRCLLWSVLHEVSVELHEIVIVLAAAYKFSKVSALVHLP